MENASDWISRPSRKRKLSHDGNNFPLDEVNCDLLESVLSWLPTTAFFRLRSLCKRWKSFADSGSFKLACSRVPSRHPWFFMMDPNIHQSIVFDSAERAWKKLNQPTQLCDRDFIPVASSGGLVCFRNMSGDYLVCNPVTASCRELPLVDPDSQYGSLNAIAMNARFNCNGSYKLVLVSGDLPKLSFKVYNSSSDRWEEEIVLRRKADETTGFEANEDDAVYFLSKAGNVVATNMQRSPSKQFSSVFTFENGEEIVNFLSSSGTVVACNLTRKYFSEYPRLLPVSFEHSIDVVECGGEMLVVLLSEFFESASVRVWRFNEETNYWTLIAAMPPRMSHELYGKTVDINCVGAGGQIFICLNSAELCSYVLCDLVTNDWVELPNCSINDEAMEFMSAFSFEPRIEASV